MIDLRRFIIGLALCSVYIGALAELPQYSPEKHLGVASCASGVCHGSVRPRTSTGISQNEYVIWSRLDRHKNAYNILLSNESKDIAHNMGLKNAHEAKVCLDCHADNVPMNKRGAKFQIEDGVSCEACHGGAEKYLTSHTDKDVPRNQNLDSGLYATDRIPDRATLCFSCHIGNEKKIASHEIMGAGHPRLSFELDTFGVLQPAHYIVDDQYSENKWSGNSLTTWALGQVEAGQQTLRLIDSNLSTRQLFPELSLFDCHACHHSMSDKKWEQRDRINLPPGSVRLNDVGFLMLFPIAKIYAPSLSDDLHSNLKQLHSLVNNGKDINNVLGRLTATLNALGKSISTSTDSKAAQKLMAQLISMGAKGEFLDYVAAEQAVMAIDMLLSTSSQRDNHTDWLDALYDSVQEEDRYNPDHLTRIMGRFK
jgi:hypothetical protein